MLKELETRDDIVITKADKGGAVVIMDVDSYIKEAKRQLENEESYKKLPNNLTKVHADCINKTIERFKNEGLITGKVANGLKSHEPKTPKFSLLPKIHKEGIPDARLLIQLIVIQHKFRNTWIIIYNRK